MRAMLAALISFLAHRVARIRRRHVESSIRRARLPDATASAMFHELATSLLELLWVSRGWLAPTDVVHIPDDVVQRIGAARAKGPVMLWCAHTSNWELLAMRAAALFPLALVVKTQGLGLADRFIQRERARAGLRTILPAGALAEARASFTRGEVVATVIDQVPASRTHGDAAMFLGAPALVDRAPAVLARRVGAHVFVIFASRDARGRVVATLVMDLAPDVVTESAPKALMAHATAALEAHVRAHPSSWLWLHRRWRMTLDDGRNGMARDEAPSSAAPSSFLHAQKEVIESTS